MVSMVQIKLQREFISFLGVGVMATASHYLLLIFLVEILGSSVLISSTAGAILGAFVSYFLNYKMTFQSNLPHKDALPKFLSVAVLAIVVNGLLMQFFTEILIFPYLPAQIISTLLIIGITFGLNKIWSFREK